MKNKIRILFTLMAVITMMTAFSTTAYAQVPDSANLNSADAAPPTETEKPKEEEDKDEEKKTEPTKPLTPDGNLTLVDDVKTTSDGEKQFLTVVSKNGNYFYIIVDRADNGENNVHFLNLVDERDLEDLIEGELSVNKEPEPVIVTPEPEPIVTPEPEPVEEPKKGLGGGAIFGGILLALALAGGGFYYFKFVKPQNDNGNPDMISEYDLEDEDEDDDDLEVEEWNDEEEKEPEKKEEPETPNFFKERQKQIDAYANKTSVINGEEKTREEIIDELFGGEDE